MKGLALANVQQDPDADDRDTWHCNRCDTTKSVEKFAKWAIKQNQHLCIVCATTRSHEAYLLRKSSLSRMLMARLRKHMHKDGTSRSATQKLRLSHMEKLVTLQGGRSIFSGIANVGRLTVGRWDNSLPWSFSNLVILTYAEAREHNKRKLCTYHTAYVAHVETHLLLSRHSDEVSMCDIEDRCNDEGSITPRAAQEAPYPPKSMHKRGFTTDLAMWYWRNFNVMHPGLHKSSEPSRCDLIPRTNE